MFENIMKFFKKAKKSENVKLNSKDTAKERLHLVLMQDRANVSVDFLDLMRQEIIEVIKKYIDIDESAMDVRLTNQANEDGTQGAPALYANIPIVNIKDETRKLTKENDALKEEKTELKDIEDNSNQIQKEEEVKKVEEAKKIVEEENKDNETDVVKKENEDAEENNVNEENEKELNSENIENVENVEENLNNPDTVSVNAENND